MQGIKNLIDREFVKELKNNNSRKCNNLIIQMKKLQCLDENSNILPLFSYNEIKEYRTEFKINFELKK